MAITPQPPHNTHLQPPSSIPINMATLTHSELHSLSLLSSPSPPPSNDVVSNTQFFINPSLSTHQQTYSPSPHPHHRHLRHHDHLESNLIISFLKKHLDYNDSDHNLNENVVEIVNKHGVVIDLAALEERDRHGGLFVDELRKMADGRFNEEELLRMLESIQGEWCSRRKKTRVVDASLLGDALPLGWKIIVALRRKGGHFSPYCRRYISPTGEKFSSCKEVSSYLQPYFGINDASLVRDNRVEFQQLQTVNAVNHMCTNSEHDNFMLNQCNSTIRNTSTCAPMELEMEASILGIDNLPDVQVCDLYECHSCKLSFDAKDKYLEHMFSLHQNTTKRYTLDSSVGDEITVKDGNSERPKRKRKRKHGSSVADGVIMKNGKYGCQFCDKVFEERRRYLGHVGNHVKGSIKTPQDLLAQLNGSAKALCVDKSPTAISNNRMDALIEIAQSSVKDNSTRVFEKEPSSINCIDRLKALNTAENSQGTDGDRNNKENSGSCLTEADTDKGCREGKILSAELIPCETVSQISSLFANKTAREGFEEGRTSSPDLHPACNGDYRANDMLMTDVDNHLDPSLSQHDEWEIGEDKSFSSELNPQEKMEGNPRTKRHKKVPTSCPNECGLEKNVMEGKTLSTKMNQLAKMSTTISSELNSQGEAKKILRTDENINVATSCPIECEIKKDVKLGEILPKKLDPLSEMSKVATTDEEMKGQNLNSNIVDIEKDACFETSMRPDAKNGFTDNVRGNRGYKSTVAEDEISADKPVDVNNIHDIWCKEKASDPVSSGKKIQMEPLHKFEPLHAQKYGYSEMDTDSDKNHASGCTVPQSSLNSSSSFDEIFEKAGQDICSLDQNLDSVSGVEFMKLDAIEPQMYKYDSMSQEDSISFYEVSMDLENNIGLGLELDNSAKSRSEFPQEMSGKCLTTTVCVWCGVEFSHEIVDVEPQPDSVGFMCPGCRAKISKQFNELERSWRREEILLLHDASSSLRETFWPGATGTVIQRAACSIGGVVEIKERKIYIYKGLKKIFQVTAVFSLHNGADTCVFDHLMCGYCLQV